MSDYKGNTKSGKFKGSVLNGSALFQNNRRDRVKSHHCETLDEVCTLVTSSSDIDAHLTFSILITVTAFADFIHTPADLRKLLETFPTRKEDIYQHAIKCRELMVVENAEQLQEIFPEHKDEIKPTQPRSPSPRRYQDY
ncbi:MAG: hypothetical protein P4M12_09355 [Gammaproteobacteria bacterium]|nr:hypothetical protein [Gammaproteobacteria bacterium]